MQTATATTQTVPTPPNPSAAAVLWLRSQIASADERSAIVDGRRDRVAAVAEAHLGAAREALRLATPSPAWKPQAVLPAS